MAFLRTSILCAQPKRRRRIRHGHAPHLGLVTARLSATDTCSPLQALRSRHRTSQRPSRTRPQHPLATTEPPSRVARQSRLARPEQGRLADLAAAASVGRRVCAHWPRLPAAVAGVTAPLQRAQPGPAQLRASLARARWLLRAPRLARPTSRSQSSTRLSAACLHLGPKWVAMPVKATRTTRAEVRVLPAVGARLAAKVRPQL
mmetsp:Transcript_6306/g.22441  ORF Transcript_6306/g.22441 Transcript_6306/m.22441 type:complete len:203 (-) Transcript_6306:2249-2857(-)